MKFYIDKNSNVESGTYDFDAWLYFKNSSGDTALLKVTNQSMYIAPSLSYVNPEDATDVLTTNTYNRKYNAYASSDNHENMFSLVATDKSNLTSNSNVKYCIYDETSQTCAATNDSNVLTLVDNGNGIASITAKTYQTADSDISIRAYMEDNSGTVLTYENITIQINRSERKMKWEGTGISSINSTVTEKAGGFELKLPYDSANSVEYAYAKILKNASASARGTLALRHDEGTGSMSMTMNGNLASGTATDSFKQTGKCTGTSCYIEVSKAQDDIFEAGTVKLYIVSEDMMEIDNAKITWNYQTDTTWKVATNPLTVDYKENGMIPVKIDTTKLPTDIKNVSISYSLEDTTNANTITVANKSGSTLEAEMVILQANQTTDNANIKAVITSDNYAQKIVVLPVKVNKLAQTIDFNTIFKELTSSIKVDTSVDYNYSTKLQVDASTAGKGTVNYTVAGNPVDMLTNNAENTTFNVTKAGSVTITATLTDDKNYTSSIKSVSKTITYFEDAGVLWTQNSSKPEAVNTINGGVTGDADVNKEIGSIAIDGGKSEAYNFSVDNSKHSDDSTYFSVVLNADKKSGKVKIIKKIDATVLNTHATQVGVGDTYEWIIHMQAVGASDATDKAEVDIKIIFTGAQPEITFDEADINKKITDSYVVDKNMEFHTKRGGVAVSAPTISIIGYTSALTLNTDGVSATIKGANTDNNNVVRSGRKMEVKAEVTASSGYKTGTSDLNEVIIKKADHPSIDFVVKSLSSSNNVDVFLNGVLNGNNKFNEDVTITPIKTDPLDAWVIEPYSVSKGEAYEQPKMAMSPKGYLGTLDFTITASGDDNYKPLPDNTKTTLEFTENGGITYKPINVVYGDKEKNVLDFIVSPSPEDDPNTVTYEYSGYDNTIITVDSDGKTTPLKVGNTTLTFKRMDSGDNSEMEQNIKVTVKPKDITIYVNDLHMKVGEIVTVDDYTMDTTRSTPFESGDDVGTLTYSCQDNNVEVTSFANGLQGPSPKTLPINATYIGGDASKKANYAITYMPGNLNITQDEAQESWISVLPKGMTTLQNTWYNGDVEIKLNAISGSYSEISSDGNAPWGNSFTISEEGVITQKIAFRDPTSLAKATSITKELLIDKHAPRVISIKAKSSNNKLEDIMNSMTFGLFFKPGTEFAITTTDKQTGSSVNRVSGTNSLFYSIYRVEKDNSETVLEKDKTITIKDETAKIKISDHSGTYKVCTIATDLAGNKGTTENCANVIIGYKGMNETTGDNNCPDLNLDFNDDGIAELNIDIDGDKIPDLNIDSDFDGEADINVDSDKDQNPDLNLVELSEWNPGMCSTIDGNTYATMEDIEPKINVVMNNEIDEIKDQSPYLNIDTSGDMEADFNVSFDGVKPYLNIGKVPEQWIPETDYTTNDFAYDTMKDLEPLLNMGIIDGKHPSINIDTNKDGKADVNIDTDGDGIPNVNIDGDGDGKEDINIDTDNNGTPDEKVLVIESWKPDTLVDGEVPFKTMKLSYIEKGNDSLTDKDVTIEKPNGSFLPNHSLKVNDVTTEEKDKIKNNLPNDLKDKNIEAVFDVQYYVDDKKVQPGERIKVKIPVKEGLRNPVLLVETADGSFKSITPKEENGHYVYETDFLGFVSILGDTDKVIPDEKDPIEKKDDVVLPTPGKNIGGSNQPNTSVKGTYTTGTNTGDATNIILYGIVFTSAIIFILAWMSKGKKYNS